MKNYLNIEELKDMFCFAAGELKAKEDYLTELDIPVGDGDHGRNMSMAFGEVEFELPRMQFTCMEDVFLAVGTIIMDVCGGASGVLFGTMFVSGTVRRQKHFTMSLEDIAEIFRVSLDALMSRGKARPGDKTMIDALEPAVRAFEKAAEEDYPLKEGMKMAAEAAKVGMEYTKELQARFGRAKYYPEKGRGLQDPGATSVWIIFQAMADWAENQDWTEAKTDYQVTTLTLNPCMDKTIDIDALIYGGTNKIRAVQNDISGKGINVSAVLRNFGVTTRCLGFNYSEGARVVEKFLDDLEIPHDFVRVPGHLRTNIKIFEQSTRTMMEFNEAGLSVPKEALNKLMDKIEDCTRKTTILTLSGSLPTGVPANTYRNIIQNANLTGCKTILDTSGKSLQEGIKAIPYMIKPNVQELTNAFAEEIEAGKTLDDIVKMLLTQGIHYICLSAGNRGTYLATQEKILYAKPLDILVRGVQGAGDSMVAGMCMAILQEKSDEEVLAYGMAAAGGSLERSGTLLCLREDLERLLPQVKVQEVDRIEL